MKLIGLLAGLSFLVASVPAWAEWQCDYNGNCYYSYSDGMGNTHVQGNNLRTGSMWNSTIDRDGNQHGMDSQGNFWDYNNDTKTYLNYGTGEMCIGTGYARTCIGGRRWAE